MTDIVPLRKNVRFQLLWIGSAVSESGSELTRLAMPLLVLALTGSPGSAGIVAGARTITFLAATLFYAFAKVPRRPADEPQISGREDGEEQRPIRRGMRREAAEAIAWLWHQYGLREVTAAVMVLNLLGGAFLIPLIVLVGERGGDARVTGTVLAGLGIGGLTGALLSGRISRLLPPGRLLLAVVTVFGAALAATALPWGAWWPMIPLMFITLSTPSLNVVMSVVVARISRVRRGRPSARVRAMSPEVERCRRPQSRLSSRDGDVSGTRGQRHLVR
ncbi:hypothetical protein HDA43_000378 [Streptosporangium sandarakinum]|uniref:MFS transporter n=1 Tax=Streptosporangium sandarakinum TaxID=1260955 RepID=A0A852UPV5_9ACTN|nr:hypothetical protein [Streptosporangium sandarakinum]NYF38219.1 hypothetical protein [Streptosporangium sandarakinum]